MRAPLPYAHTQIGWITLVAALSPLLILAPLASEQGASTPVFIAVLVLLVTGAVFSSLNVQVDEEAVRIRFGLGLIRRTFLMSSIVSYAQVENPWSYGWGIRYYPGGTLYNVAGKYAVELALDSGKRVRIGTDEPAQMLRALHAVLGAPKPVNEMPRAANSTRRRVLIAVVSGFIAAVIATLLVLMRVQARPPRVTVSATEVRVDNLFYGDSYPYSHISSTRLADDVPHVLARTNGYDLNGTLRGWFKVKDLGSGKLFIEEDHPPFILLELNEGFVFLNFSDPTQTRATFDSIERNWRVARGSLNH